jgi:hypothetical protein
MLAIGDVFTVWNAQRIGFIVANGTYNGPIQITNNSVVPPVPIGQPTPRNPVVTGPNFNIFVVVRNPFPAHPSISIEGPGTVPPNGWTYVINNLGSFCDLGCTYQWTAKYQDAVSGSPIMEDLDTEPTQFINPLGDWGPKFTLLVEVTSRTGQANAGRMLVSN